MVALKDGQKDITTGDPNFCKNCSAAVNQHSQVSEDGGWACEFCSYYNKLELVEGEKPDQENVNYMLEPAAKVEVVEEKKEGETVGNMSDDKSTIMFCIDISGSMAALASNPN